MSKDAIEKFEDAVSAYRLADDDARNKGRQGIDLQRFQEVIIDLDAAVPGLEGLMLGRALVLKASCLWWIYLGSIRKAGLKQFFQDYKGPNYESLLSQGLPLALKGREILINEKAEDYDISWANNIVEAFEGNK